MPRPITRVIVSSAALSLGIGVAGAWAQAPRGASPVSVQVSMRAGVVSGVVRDSLGQVVPGVAVTAIGTTQAQAKTDSTGQFRLPLVPGDYILRATRAGYVSPYRESIRIRASAQLERNITITRQPGLPERQVLLASTGMRLADPGRGDSVEDAETAPSPKAESLHAWYLRYLPRTVLRDGGGPAGTGDLRTDFRYLPSFLDWAVAGSARAATTFFSDTDFSGQVNVLTTSAMSATRGWTSDHWPRGVAYLAVGAPVGTHGDWRIRGALSAGGLASWVMLGEYEARDARTHAFRMGMSYGAQQYAEGTGPALLKVAESTRTLATVYVFDRWRARPGLEIDYGLRTDRYDYVVGRTFLSPRAGVRLGVLPRTFVTASASSAVVAPGVDEFLPPPSSGPWLPPDRTFSALVSGSPFQPERVQRFEVGAEREFGVIGQSRTVGVRWFHEATRDQLATMFGLDAAGSVGHYYVATAGDVTLNGWAVRASGSVTSRVRATLDYSISHASWQFGPQASAIAAVMPSALRPERERLHDLTSTLEAQIPETDTYLLVAYRMNSAFSRPDAFGIEPVLDGRFHVQLRQALPFQPISGGKIEVLMSVNNLFRDPQTGGAFGGSFYDELLTVRTPRRVLGGVQVRF